MNDRFIDTIVHRHHRFSLGVDQRTGDYYLSTPISGLMLAAEYEEYFRISASEFAVFRADPDSAESFLETCRNHGHTNRLIGPA